MRLLVIGGVAAGLSAASRARRIDKSLEILVLEKGDHISYGACGLPYYLEGDVKRLDELMVYSLDFFPRERNIAVHIRSEVTAIHHSRREVQLARGKKIAYDRLIIATGARPDDQGIEGAGLPHVFSLHTMTDAQKLKAFLKSRRPRSGVVIGAGYIGLEMAEALRANGMAVTVLESSPHVLNREDPELTKILRTHLERFGVELRCNAAVSAIEPDRVGDVSCDIVVRCTGLKPNVEMAAAAGVDLGHTGAIRVNERMETNLSGIYAAGDCVETTHLVTGRPVHIPLGTTANKMGRVAGACAAGAREQFEGVAGTAIVRACGLGVAITGLSAHQARKEGFDPLSVRIQSRDRARYFRGRPTTVELVVDRRGRRLLGGSVTGENGVEGRINVIATALAARMRIDDFEQLDLAYAPPFAPVWDPLLIAAQQALKTLSGQSRKRE